MARFVVKDDDVNRQEFVDAHLANPRLGSAKPGNTKVLTKALDTLRSEVDGYRKICLALTCANANLRREINMPRRKHIRMALANAGIDIDVFQPFPIESLKLGLHRGNRAHTQENFTHSQNPQPAHTDTVHSVDWDFNKYL